MGVADEVTTPPLPQWYIPVLDEVATATGEVISAHESLGAIVDRLTLATRHLTDAEFARLSPETQDWVNGQVARRNEAWDARTNRRRRPAHPLVPVLAKSVADVKDALASGQIVTFGHQPPPTGAYPPEWSWPGFCVFKAGHTGDCFNVPPHHRWSARFPGRV